MMTRLYRHVHVGLRLHIFNNTINTIDKANTTLPLVETKLASDDRDVGVGRLRCNSKKDAICINVDNRNCIAIVLQLYQ